MGVHTGDSITVAPAQTLTDREYQMMRDGALACLREVGVDTGGSNVQFAIEPQTGRMVVIEMNPRVSRSSALASKATGFPIAKIAAKLAVGFRLDEISNDITRKTPACFEPTIDYVVVKIPKWQFEKFPGSEPLLGVQMKSIGEVMAIGRTFKQRAVESHPQSRNRARRPARRLYDPELIHAAALLRPTPERLNYVRLRAGRGVTRCKEIAEMTRIDSWFLAATQDRSSISKREIEGEKPRNRFPAKSLSEAKRLRALRCNSPGAHTGQTDGRHSPGASAKRRRNPAPSSSGSIPAPPNLKASRRICIPTTNWECESEPTDRRKVIILGSRPQPHWTGNRIRLLLLSRLVRAYRRCGLRVDHGQLQPRDRIDRLRHQ